MAGVFGWLDDKLNGDAETKLKDDYLITPMKNDGMDLNEKNDKSKEKKINVRDYKVTVPKRQELPATKILNDATAIFHYLNSSEDFFFQTENFQRKYLYEVPKLLWNTERVEDLGDFVLLFPNPDKKAAQDLDPAVENGILLKDAEEAFHLIFDTTYNYPYKKKFTTALLEAFKKAFLELEEYEKPKKSGILNLNIFNPLSFFSKKKPEDAKQSEKKDPTSKSKQHKKGDPKKDQKELFANLPDLPNEETRMKEQQGAAPPQPAEKVDPQAEPKKKELTDEEKEKELQKKLKKQRKVWGGKLYSFKNMAEGALAVDGSPPKPEAEAQHNFIWSRDSSKTTKDLMTLLRKATCAVLANQGFMIREVFVNDGEQIALILTTTEDNIEKMVLQMGMTRKLDFGFSDVVSLEPVDSKYRPLRLNLHLHNEELWEKAYTLRTSGDLEKDVLMELRTRILDLLSSEANFKKIARMCQSPWPQEAGAEIYEPSTPSLGEWIAYHDYLVEVAVQVKCIQHSIAKVQSAINIFYTDKRVVFKGNKPRKAVDQQDLLIFTRLEVVSALKEAFLRQNQRCKDGIHMLSTLLAKASSKQIHKALAEYKKVTLKSIWDAMRTAPIEYEFPYFVGHNKMRKRNREFFDSIWKKYYFVNEAADLKSDSSHKDGIVIVKKFSTPERIEAVNFLVPTAHPGQQSDQPAGTPELVRPDERDAEVELRRLLGRRQRDILPAARPDGTERQEAGRSLQGDLQLQEALLEERSEHSPRLRAVRGRVRPGKRRPQPHQFQPPHAPAEKTAPRRLHV